MISEKKFVSRGGEKLAFGLKHFEIEVKDKICADFGCSTGGFTDCLLQNGARKVYSVDTAYGELAWKLRNDPRVVVMERTNAMHVSLPESVDLIAVDTGWTKQAKVIPNALKNLKKDGVIVSLVKPHYEAGKNKLSETEIKKVLEEVKNEIASLGLAMTGVVESPILGGRAENKEFLMLITKG